MKIIDLLNKIAKGEEVPKKIRIAGWSYKFEWKEHLENYYDDSEDIDLMSALSMSKDELVREVKEVIILEDKIREQYLNLPIEKLNKNNFHKKQRQLANKINELTEKVNYLLEKESDK